MIILTKPNFLGINFDLKVFTTGAMDKKIFSLFEKENPSKPSGLEVKNELIKEYTSKKIVIPKNTWDTEVSFDEINNVRFLTIFAKINTDSYSTSKQPDFLLKLGSKTATSFSVQEFIHFGFKDGIEKIFISNPYIFDLELIIFYAGDDSEKDNRIETSFIKTNELKYWIVNHNLGFVPSTYLLIDENGETFTDFTTISLDEHKAVLSFNSVFKGQFILKKDHHHTQSSSSTVWNIVHNLDMPVTFICFDENNIKLNPTAQYISNNEIELTFETSVKGTAVIY